MNTTDTNVQLSVHQQGEPVLLLPTRNDGLGLLERGIYLSVRVSRAFSMLFTMSTPRSQVLPNHVQHPRCFVGSSKGGDVTGIGSAVLDHCLARSFAGLDFGFGGNRSLHVVKNSNQTRGNFSKTLEARDCGSHSFEVVQPLHPHWDVEGEGDTYQSGDDLDPRCPFRLAEAGPSKKIELPANSGHGLHESLLGRRGQA